MRRSTSWLSAGLLLLAVAPAAAQEDIILQKDSDTSTRVSHFTRYTPPALEELPPEAKVHIIEKGDTLWDLATTLLGDPYFWPQLWDANRYITDPHWIYPGDPILIPQPVLITEIAPPVEEFDEFEALPPPTPVASRHDVYCATYIVDKDDRGSFLSPGYEVVHRRIRRSMFGERTILPEVEVDDGAPRIVAAEKESTQQTIDDVVFLNRGEAQGVAAGDEFLIVRPKEIVADPAGGRDIGVALYMLGTLKVLCTQAETATARIATACDTITVGDLLRPSEPIPIPLASEYLRTSRFCETQSDRPAGQIVYAKYQKTALSTEDVVNIDLGSSDGIVPGDFLVAYRPNRQGDRFPATVLGDVVVLLVEEQTATAKILSSYGDLALGDRVQLR